MPLPRRHFLKLALAAPFAAPAASGSASRGVDAFAVHEATSNTRLGVLVPRPLFGGKPPVSKRYEGFPREPLAKVGLASEALAHVVPAFTPAHAFVPGSISRDTLSGLLLFTNGVTGQVVGKDPPVYRRAAPSAGARYAGEVYVLAQRVKGLAPGLYAYQPHEHALVTLRPGKQLRRVLRALEEPGAARNAAAVVVLTNVFHRSKWRYGERGYRYALIDSGHIAENLRLAASAVGLGVSSPLRFEDDALNAVVGQDGRSEAVCAVLAIGQSSEWGDEGSAGPRLVERQVAEAVAGGSLDTVERYHEGTKLVPLAGGEAMAPEEPEPPVEEGEPAVAFSELEVLPQRLVTECIWSRRSARAFAPGPLARWELGFVTGIACGSAELATRELEPWVVVHAVEDVAPGLYRALAGGRGLALVRGGDLRGALRRACLGQAKAETAAVAFLVVADVARARRRAGDRSYRDLLLGAGAMAERVYLGAEAIDLAARNLAAFLDASLNELVGVDGHDRAVVHLTVLGREPSEPGGST